MENASTRNQPVKPDADEELVARCKEEIPHRTEAFHELLNKYEPMVYHTCLRMLGNAEEAEETCQDAFLRVFNKIHQFEGRSAFKTWLFRVVYNFCMTRRRNLASRRERKELITEEFTQQEAEDRRTLLSDSSPDTEQVQKALSRLREDDREIIVLRFFSELSLDEIAEVLNLKLSATKMRLYRAMDRFKAVFSRETENSGHLGGPTTDQ